MDSPDPRSRRQALMQAVADYCQTNFAPPPHPTPRGPIAMPATVQDTVETTKALDILLDVVRRTANQVVSSVETIKDHPTYVTKSMIRAEHQRLQGALDAYTALAYHLGFDTRPASVCEYRDKADSAVAELATLPTGRRAR